MIIVCVQYVLLCNEVKHVQNSMCACIKQNLTITGDTSTEFCLWIFLLHPVLEWSTMGRETPAARQKATSCLPLWLETTGFSSGPLVADSTWVGSLGRPGFWPYVLFSVTSGQLFLKICFCLLFYLPEQPRLPVWWMNLNRLVSINTLSNSLVSCIMQTRSANGSLDPRLHCAAWILSRWDIYYIISWCIAQISRIVFLRALSSANMDTFTVNQQSEINK